MPDASHFSRFETYADYRVAFADILKKATRRIWIGERTLEEADVLWEFFTQSSPGAVRILVRDPEYLLSRCPRIMQLRERFAHLMEIRTPSEAPDAWQQGVVLVDEDDYLVRRHFDWPKGEVGQDGRESAIWEHVFCQLWEHSSPPSDMHRLNL